MNRAFKLFHEGLTGTHALQRFSDYIIFSEGFWFILGQEDSQWCSAFGDFVVLGLKSGLPHIKCVPVLEPHLIFHNIL